MAVGVIWYPPVDQQAYEAIRDRVISRGRELGMTHHVAGESDGQWRILEVWDSREGLDEFVRDVLQPTAAELTGGQGPAPEPEVVFDAVWQWP
jgi:hypothetical protein